MAAASRAASTARAVQSEPSSRDRIAEALYEWCRNEKPVGHVFNQDNLLDSGIIPNRDGNILMTAIQHLTRKNLFRTHDVKGTGGIGWELVSQERAANYIGLTREETLIFQHIDAAGNAGIWTKLILKRVMAHQKVLERTYKSLEAKGRIRPMKSVMYPQRKMYIVAGLQPGEDATGGAWFNEEGKLDTQLLDGVTLWLEKHVSDRSWVAVRPPDQDDDRGQTWNQPSLGKGKSTAASIDDDGSFDVPGREPSKSLNTSQVAKGARFPPTAVAKLLDVMVYDEKLYKVYRQRHSNELAGDAVDDRIVMYRSYRSPGELDRTYHMARTAETAESGSARKAARRQLELEEVIQGGGASEVPCLRCPTFDLCGDGGPVNVATCPYFDEWYLRVARTDRDNRSEWADSEDFIKIGDRKQQERERVEALSLPKQMVQLSTEAMDTT
ncbi:DNA-directed RNA polymerase III subunit RPC6 [Cyphellophora attinorum]|uniref:DNA-directed RNA polymerase III subunit RPC6 n=1 Tax=Cyphellophora attinorum TaxID=1664694 RepID=A0A0N1H2I0_9EURO|nr:DNA-directed RNA polymerase III subunit RPC6 [Phialophora attinorum]KPI38697.1 DNA-directed RNA polymerase III subunit RPC6 [Phialophora attinorum]